MAKRKILVVDDEIDFIDMVRMRLEANDFTVVTANDGENAMEAYKTEKPSAILLDILMPGMDGLEVLKKIREIDKKIPIFMITAFSNEERFKIANNYSASGFIVKTSDIQSEIRIIISAIEIAERSKGKE